MIAAARLTTEYTREDFAALHFAPDPDHVGRVSVHCLYNSDRMGRVFYCDADQLPDRLAALQLSGWDYYITANSFSGGTRRIEDLFALQNIVLDVDAHAEDLPDQDRDRAIDSLAFFAASDLPLRPNTIVRTGRGLQLWWAIEPISYKAEQKYNIVRDKLIEDVEQLLRGIPSLDVLQLDPAPSHNAAGLFRLPGSYNTKAGRIGSFELIHEERLDVVELWQDLAAQQIRIPGEKIQRIPEGGADTIALAQFREGRILQLLRIRQAAGLQLGEELRDLFVFCLYNVLTTAITDHDQIMKRVHALNDRFLQPLTDRELEAYLRTSARKRYRLTNAKIIELLQITPEEQATIGLYPAGSGKTDLREQLRQDARDRKAERDAKICELFDQGRTQAAIAEEVGCSAATVGRVLHKSGHASRSEQLQQQICELIRKGLTIEEIAAETGASRSTVYDHIRKARDKGENLTADAINDQVGVFIDTGEENGTAETGATQAGHDHTEAEAPIWRELSGAVRKISKTRSYKGTIYGPTMEDLRDQIEARFPVITDPEDLERRRCLIAQIEANRARRARLRITAPG